MAPKQSFSEQTALTMYHELKTDKEIGLAVGKSADTISTWRKRRNLPCISNESENVHYSKILTPTEQKHMREFLFKLFTAGKKAAKAGVKPDVGHFINVYCGKYLSEKEKRTEKMWQARERRQIAIGG